MPKIVIVSTSASQWTGGPSGVWLEEVACPYYVFTAAGHEVSKERGRRRELVNVWPSCVEPDPSDSLCANRSTAAQA